MNKIFNLRNIYLFMVGYFIWAGTVGGMFFNWNLSHFMDFYFGRTQYVIYLILLINYAISYAKTEKKKVIFTIINYFIYVGVISGMLILISYNLEIFSKTDLKSLEYNFMELSLFRYKLGLVPTYLNFILIFNESRNIFYFAYGIAVFNMLLMTTLMLNWGIFYHLKKIKKGYLLRQKMEQEERELQEKIALKEMLEKKEVERIKMIREATEKRIREEVTNLNFERSEYDVEKIREKIQKEMEEKDV